MFIVAALLACAAASLPHPPAWLNSIDDKAQHALVFAVLACLARAAYRQASSLVLATGLATLGGFIEVIQLVPALHRQSSLLDLLADLAGIILGLAVAGLIPGLRQHPAV